MLPRLVCCCKEEAQKGSELVTRISTPKLFGTNLEEDSLETESNEEQPQECNIGPLLEGQHEKMPEDMCKEPDGDISTALGILPAQSTSGQKISLTFEDDEILRATSIKSVLHNGSVILQDSAGTEDTYSQSQTTTKIDVFISHNWGVPRQKKFWALTLHFNLLHALVASYIGVAVGCLLNVLEVPPTFLTSTGIVRPHCQILGSVVFFIVLLVGHDLPFLGRCICRQRVFLDKVCIHQTDPALKVAGIRSLGAFLSHSERMLVLFHNLYVQKLWTVYEMACFMYLHRRDKLDLLPVDIARVTLQSTAVLICLQSLITVVTHVGAGLGVGASMGMFSGLCCALVCVVPLAFILRAWALQRSDLYTSVRSFQIQKARCADENDRPIVSANICSFVRSMGLAQDDTSEEKALESFDKLVQENMPEQLQSAVGRTGLPYKYAVLAGQTVVFYTFDNLSSQSDLSINFALAWLVWAFNMQAVTIPSAFLVCGWVSSKCPRQGRWAELALKFGIAFVAYVTMMSIYFVTAFFRAKVMVNVWWAVPHAVSFAVETIIMAKLF